MRGGVFLLLLLLGLLLLLSLLLLLLSFRLVRFLFAWSVVAMAETFCSNLKCVAIPTLRQFVCF